MKKFGLIGHPISHSLSPALFKAAYGGKYAYDLIEGEDFEKSYEKFINEYDAINVTAPFKELAYAKADGVSDESKAVRAANILIKDYTKKVVFADNSDIAGVSGALQSAGLSSDNSKKALIVGCGGAAMAAAYSTWIDFGFDTVIINRNIEKARNFVKEFKEANGNHSSHIYAEGIERFEELFCKADVVIYTLPVAIPALYSLRRSAIRGGGFWRRKRRKVILEANYKDPAFTPEITEKMCRTNNKISFISGKEWLLHQAVGAYEAFTGEAPNIAEMRKVL